MPRTPRQTKKQISEGPPPQGGGPSFLAVARIKRPFGIKGELLLDLLSEPSHWMLPELVFYVGEDHRPFKLESIHAHGRETILRLAGVADRDAAEALRGLTLWVNGGSLKRLEAGEYYYHQVIGLEAVTESGDSLGRVKDILKTGANDVYIVEGTRGEILLPAIAQVVREIRLDEKKMIVRLLDGLLG